MKTELRRISSCLKHTAILCTGLALLLITSHAAEKAAAPEWVKHNVPEQIKPYVGKPGLPEAWRQGPEFGAGELVGTDVWQANNFIVHREETAKFLYNDYTPLKVDYKKGTFPALEKIVAEYTAGLKSDKDKAVALLTKAMPVLMRHPAVPPYGKPVPPNRNFNEEQLVESAEAWCNEQARVFIRLCQIAGIPARMISLFYADNKNGHCISEFYADGRWSMSDNSYFVVFPGKDGHLMSAAEAHEEDARPYVNAAYAEPLAKLQNLGEAELGAPGKQEMVTREEIVNRLYVFGVVNYPLPQ